MPVVVFTCCCYPFSARVFVAFCYICDDGIYCCEHVRVFRWRQEMFVVVIGVRETQNEPFSVEGLQMLAFIKLGIACCGVHGRRH